MKFLERVKRRMERGSYECETTKSKVIDMVCTHKGRKTALRIKSHGRIYNKERKDLIQYGIKHSVRVLYVHETGERELAFTRIYPLQITHANGTQNSNV